MARRRTRSISRTTVMTLDPGFSHLGLAVIRLEPYGRPDTLLNMDVIVTKKSQLKVTVNADNLSRNRELARALDECIDRYDVTMLTYESYSMPQQANKPNLVKIGFPYGILAALGEVYGLPTVMRTPQAVKKAVCGHVGVSKRDVEDTLKARFYPGNEQAVDEFERRVPNGRRNHAWDAIGAFVAAETSDVMRALRGR